LRWRIPASASIRRSSLTCSTPSSRNRREINAHTKAADWAWPFVHRGITHTPLFALAVVAGGYAVGRQQTSTIGRRVALAIGLALGSHLAIDSLSPKGIDVLFPLRTSWSPGLPVHSPTATVFLWTASIALLVWDTDEQRSI